MTEEDGALIEAMARMLRAHGDSTFEWKDFIPAAEAALTAITEAGYVVCPREPTEHTISCIANRLPGVHSAEKRVKARHIYRAMLSTSSITTKGTNE